MGEIADMMLDGTLCEACGSAIDYADGPGHPRYCSPECARDRGTVLVSSKVNCPTCGKRVKLAGLRDHMRDVHAEFHR